jgi:hypothetical protein
MLLKNSHWRATLLAAIFLISPAFASSADTNLAIVGPVDQVNCTKGTFRVLGTTFVVNSRSLMAGSCTSGTAGSGYVVVAGRQVSSKAIANNVSELTSEIYVPGASPVFVRGAVSRVDQLTGQFEVSGTRVLALSGKVPDLGLSVDVIGTQPLLGGVVLADAIYATPASESGADLSISTAIIGSGAAANAIIGSGKSTNAIIGSGASANAIIGSGAAANAIIGSGRNTSAIIGSGSSTNAIIGSGKSTSAIIGSGASSRAIIGSGAAKN